MADQNPPPDLKPPPRPPWVKVSLMVVVGAVALLIIAMALSGGEHGPGRHMPGGDKGGHGTPERHAP